MFEKKFFLIFLSLVALFLAALVVASSGPRVSQKPSGFAPDFSWVKGKLEFNPLEGGFWQIRFGDESALYGGKFVLGKDPRLTGFKDGDLVLVKGQIAEEQVSIFMAGTIYTLESIDKR